MNDLVYWIWLQQALGYGSSRTEQLLNAFEGSPKAVYEADWNGLLTKGMLTRKQLELLRGYRLQQAQTVVETVPPSAAAPLPQTAPNIPNLCARPMAIRWFCMFWVTLAA